MFMSFWKPLIPIACLLSSHFYAYASFFGLKWHKDDTSMGSLNWVTDYVLFAIFTIDIIVNFITEYCDVGEIEPCRDLEKIS